MENKPLVRTKIIDVEKELSEIASKRIRTSFIYAVAELEEMFGDLWGEMKDENEELTPEEEKWYNKFMEWRKNILDNGNNQIRLVKSEIKRIVR
jgi:hypothetical protein